MWNVESNLIRLIRDKTRHWKLGSFAIARQARRPIVAKYLSNRNESLISNSLTGIDIFLLVSKR